jgi:hypothetical protein
MSIDVKRTVKASQFTGCHGEDGAEYPEYGTPGEACRYPAMPDHLVHACPGCGRMGAIKADHPKPSPSPSWDIVAGSLDDVTTLTLSPSIHCKGCCGWHGYLKNGVFESC